MIKPHARPRRDPLPGAPLRRARIAAHRGRLLARGAGAVPSSSASPAATAEAVLPLRRRVRDVVPREPDERDGRGPVCRQPMTVEMRRSPGDAHGKLAQEAAKEAVTDGAGRGGYVKEVVS